MWRARAPWWAGCLSRSGGVAAFRFILRSLRRAIGTRRCWRIPRQGGSGVRQNDPRGRIVIVHLTGKALQKSWEPGAGSGEFGGLVKKGRQRNDEFPISRGGCRRKIFGTANGR